MKFSLYITLSTLATTLVVLYAYSTRLQFYPTVIYLVSSKPTIVVLCNMAFALTLVFGRVTKRLFLGTLREAEMELVWENIRYTITETCLALTMFREELSLRILVYFTCLLFSKVFHWLCDSRVEHVEQAQEISRTSHFRISALMVVLFMTNLGFTLTSIYNVQMHGPSVELLFGFEYTVLCITIVSSFIRYCLSIVDLYFVAGRWYNKSLYELYLKLVIDTIQLMVNLIFFALIFNYYTLPLHLVRQLYLSIQNAYNRMHHFLHFRRITSNLNERFANATVEELEATDKICIICREEMEATTGPGGPKRLNCGHIFHFYCLRNWLERQLSCPTCRANIQSSPTIENSEAAIPPVDVNGQDVPPAATHEENATTEEPQDTLSNLMQQGRLLKRQGRLQEAESMFRKAILQEEQKEPKSENFGQVILLLAKLLLDRKEYREAVQWYKTAVQVQKDQFGESSLEHAQALQFHGRGLTEAKQDFEIAKEQLLQSIQVYDKIDTKEAELQKSITLYCLGTLFSAREMYEQALEYYNRSLELKLKHWKPDNSSVVATKRSIARMELALRNRTSTIVRSSDATTENKNTEAKDLHPSAVAAMKRAQLSKEHGNETDNASDDAHIKEHLEETSERHINSDPAMDVLSESGMDSHPNIAKQQHMDNPSIFAMNSIGMAPIYSPTIAQVLQQRIETLQLHLQVYQAQNDAITASREAALASLNVKEIEQSIRQREGFEFNDE